MAREGLKASARELTMQNILYYIILYYIINTSRLWDQSLITLTTIFYFVKTTDIYTLRISGVKHVKARAQ